MCVNEAMFHMITAPDLRNGGYCVTLRSYLMDQYLIVMEGQDFKFTDQQVHNEAMQQQQQQFKTECESQRIVTLQAEFLTGGGESMCFASMHCACHCLTLRAFFK